MELLRDVREVNTALRTAGSTESTASGQGHHVSKATLQFLKHGWVDSVNCGGFRLKVILCLNKEATTEVPSQSRNLEAK